VHPGLGYPTLGGRVINTFNGPCLSPIASSSSTLTLSRSYCAGQKPACTAGVGHGGGEVGTHQRQTPLAGHENFVE